MDVLIVQLVIYHQVIYITILVCNVHLGYNQGIDVLIVVLDKNSTLGDLGRDIRRVLIAQLVTYLQI